MTGKTSPPREQAQTEDLAMRFQSEFAEYEGIIFGLLL